MLDVKQAVQTAKATLKSVMQQLGEEEPEKLRLEEVELSDDDRYWMVTMSFLDQETPTVSQVLTRPLARTYRRVKIDAVSGEFRGMKDPGF